jgi:hypothetical protein
VAGWRVCSQCTRCHLCYHHAGVLFVKSVADSNAAAQDKALDALNAFLAKASEQHVNRCACVDRRLAPAASQASTGFMVTNTALLLQCCCWSTSTMAGCTWACASQSTEHSKFLAHPNPGLSSRYAEKTCSNMVAKALNGRTGTVQRATDALCAFIELEQAPAVLVSSMGWWGCNCPGCAAMAWITTWGWVRSCRLA